MLQHGSDAIPVAKSQARPQGLISDRRPTSCTALLLLDKPAHLNIVYLDLGELLGRCMIIYGTCPHPHVGILG